jgi:hypothetical protein
VGGLQAAYADLVCHTVYDQEAETRSLVLPDKISVMDFTNQAFKETDAWLARAAHESEEPIAIPHGHVDPKLTLEYQNLTFTEKLLAVLKRGSSSKWNFFVPESLIEERLVPIVREIDDLNYQITESKKLAQDKIDYLKSSESSILILKNRLHKEQRYVDNWLSQTKSIDRVDIIEFLRRKSESLETQLSTVDSKLVLIRSLLLAQETLIQEAHFLKVTSLDSLSNLDPKLFQRVERIRKLLAREKELIIERAKIHDRERLLEERYKQSTSYR